MAYGLRIKDASGNILLDTTDLVARIRYSNEVSGGVSDSIVLADISGKTVYAFSIPLEANKLAHSVSFAGTTFSWTEQSDATFNSSDSLIGVILAS